METDRRLGAGAGRRLDLRVAGGYTWRLQFRGTPGVDHIAIGPGLVEPRLLGWDDPHRSHFPLVWSEARALAAHLGGFALPLLFPMTSTRAVEQGNVRRWLREAWTRTGMLDAGRVAALVDALTIWPDERDAPVAEDADPGDTRASAPPGRATGIGDAIALMLAALE